MIPGHVRLLAPLLAGFLLLASSLSTSALTIQYSPGGEIGQFIAAFQQIRETGERIVVDGPCISACTLMTGIVPSGQICVTPNAEFGFHSAASDLRGTFSRAGNEIVWRIYPPRVRKILISHGWRGPSQPHPSLILIPGSKLYQNC